MTTRALAGVCLMLMTASFAHAQLNDRVVPYSGTATSGTVKGMTPNEVTVDSRKIAVNTIRMIQFGGEPRELTIARQRAIQGQVETALESIGKLVWRKCHRS